MRIYLAGPYFSGPDIDTHAHELRGSGYEVVSRWHRAGEWDIAAEQRPLAEWAHEAAARDLADLELADVLITWPSVNVGQSHHVELGIALGRKIPIIAVTGGTEIGMFYRHPNVTRVERTGDVARVLEGIMEVAG